YRDQRFIEHCKGKADSPLERRIRRDAFKQAFAQAMGTYRDQRFIEHCKGKADSPLERRIRRDAFKQAFAQ
ncbi:hypothetical protein CTI14_71760, partial [Methylobacterium radiotolerans]